MKTTLSTQNLVPLIESLSQNLTAIASMLRADMETAAPVDAAGAQTETQKTETEETPKQEQKTSRHKTAAKPSPEASSTGSSKESKPAITIEQVRSVLAEKSQAGFTIQVKDLLNQFGSVKLSGIDPSRYGELIDAAKALQ